ncbi:MAG: hypothetical protein A4E39_01140 [Methanoregulaceae archaeon PtaB.Bin152]|nr:MAG: hypothetical protein A4E39_01140 [Methanoregulaceae archaeon PtaB.Bin152]
MSWTVVHRNSLMARRSRISRARASPLSGGSTSNPSPFIRAMISATLCRASRCAAAPTFASTDAQAELFRTNATLFSAAGFSWSRMREPILLTRVRVRSSTGRCQACSGPSGPSAIALATGIMPVIPYISGRTTDQPSSMLPMPSRLSLHSCSVR